MCPDCWSSTKNKSQCSLPKRQSECLTAKNHNEVLFILTLCFLQDRLRLALKAAAAIHQVPIFYGPMTKGTFDKVYGALGAAATSPFPLRGSASTRLTQADSAMIEVPGAINGALSYQGWGYGRGAVSSTNMHVELYQFSLIFNHVICTYLACVVPFAG